MNRADTKLIAHLPMLFYVKKNCVHINIKWFAVVCGGLWWFAYIVSVYTTYRPKSSSGGDLWWFAVMCGGLWWFVVVCDGLRWFVFY